MRDTSVQVLTDVHCCTVSSMTRCVTRRLSVQTEYSTAYLYATCSLVHSMFSCHLPIWNRPCQFDLKVTVHFENFELVAPVSSFYQCEETRSIMLSVSWKGKVRFFWFSLLRFLVAVLRPIQMPRWNMTTWHRSRAKRPPLAASTKTCWL